MSENKPLSGRRRDLTKEMFEELGKVLCETPEILGYVGTTEEKLDRWCRKIYRMPLSEILPMIHQDGKVEIRKATFDAIEFYTMTDASSRLNALRAGTVDLIVADTAMLDLIQEEDMVVTLTHYGYVKRLPKATYRAQKRGGKGVVGATTREEDFVEQMYVVNTHDTLMFFTNRGRVYQLNCYQIPEAGRTARGTAIVNLLQLDTGEKVTASAIFSTILTFRLLLRLSSWTL